MGELGFQASKLIFLLVYRLGFDVDYFKNGKPMIQQTRKVYSPARVMPTQEQIHAGTPQSSNRVPALNVRSLILLNKRRCNYQRDVELRTRMGQTSETKSVLLQLPPCLLILSSPPRDLGGANVNAHVYMVEIRT